MNSRTIYENLRNISKIPLLVRLFSLIISRTVFYYLNKNYNNTVLRNNEKRIVFFNIKIHCKKLGFNEQNSFPTCKKITDFSDFS